MEDPGSYKALSTRDEQGGEIRWLKGQPRATHAPAHEGQLQEENTHVTARESSIVRVLASGG